MKIKDKDVMTTVKLNTEEILDIIQALDYLVTDSEYGLGWKDRARGLKQQFGIMYDNATKFRKALTLDNIREKSKTLRNPMYDIMEDKEDEWYENYKKDEFNNREVCDD